MKDGFRFSAITGIVGLNGAGKGLAAAEAALRAWRAGHVVVANIRLFPEALGFSPDLYVPLRRTAQIARLGYLEDADGNPRPELSITGNRPCMLWLDEIQACFPARQHNSLPPQLVTIINQLRKQRVRLVWTTPAWEQADAELRRVTRSVVFCRSSMPDPWHRRIEPGTLGWFPPVLRDDDGHKLRTAEDWPPRRLFVFKAYDAQDFERFTLDAQQRIKPMWRRYYWRPRHEAQLVYDTGAQVDLLDHLDFAGSCIACGGSRPRPKCSCGPLKGALGAGEAASEARPTGATPLGPVERLLLAASS